MFSTTLTNCFDDVHILDYKLMAWIQVKPHGIGYQGRYNFGVSVKDNSIFIIGGINNGCLVEQTPYNLSIDVDSSTISGLKDISKPMDVLNKKMSMKVNEKLDNPWGNSGMTQKDKLIEVVKASGGKTQPESPVNF